MRARISCIYIHTHIYICTCISTHDEGGEAQGGGRQALLGEPYRRFLGERVEASLGFGSTRTACRAGRGWVGKAGGMARMGRRRGV